MALRPEPWDALRRDTADAQRPRRGDAASIRGKGLLASGIFEAARIRATSDQTGIASAGEVTVAFDTTDYDTCADEVGGHADFSMADLSNNRLVCRAPGVYDTIAGVRWVADSVGIAPVILQLKVNGTTFKTKTHHWVNSATFGTATDISCPIPLDAGDLVTLTAIQLTGINQAIEAILSEPFLAMTWAAMFSGAA